jgi:hypothetical protein
MTADPRPADHSKITKECTVTTPGTEFVNAYQQVLPESDGEASGVRDLALMLDLDEGLAALSKADSNVVLFLAMVSIRGGDLGAGTLGQGPQGLRDYVEVMPGMQVYQQLDDPQAVTAAILRIADLYELPY